jgi:penicillin-binding protein 1A
LYSMSKLGFITQEEYTKATKTKLEINDHISGNPIQLYIQDLVRQWAENKWGREALYRNGLRIKTTIDLDMQVKAERAFAQVVHGLRSQMGTTLNGGMITLEASTGKIKVMIGGIDFRKSQFNRAVQARRQIGSSLKPILYSLALKAGFHASDVFVDEPFELEMSAGQVWRPKNWYDDFKGPMTLVRALTISTNTIAVQLLLKIGTQNLIRWCRLFGLPKDLPDYPSIVLGTPEVTVEQNAAAFNVFANNGVYVKPTLIEWVKDSTGTKLWESDYEQYRVVDSVVNSKIVNMLSHRMNMSQKLSKNGWIEGESIGKTGTTNGKGTTWFVGATPELTTALYLGHDNNKPLGLYANSTTFPIWVDFHKSVPSKKKHFYIDPSLKEVSIDWLTGEKSDDLDNENVIKILR